MNNEIDLFSNDEEIIIELELETAIAEQQTAIKTEPEQKTARQLHAKKSWKPEEEKFTAGFFIRCTQSEKLAVESEAASFEMSQSRFLIAKALNGSRVLSREEMQLFGSILQELSALGRNVNQIAHGLNAVRMHNQTIELSQNQLFNLTLEIQNLVSELKSESQKLWES
jgi:hypothetical protein